MLDLAPVAVGGGMREDGNSTWGFTMAGRMPWRDGKYHAIVAFITDHAGIESYGSHMGLAVATASVPEGPYTRPTDHLFGAVYAGNPSAAFDPVERRYVTMHQGCGPMPHPTLACVHGDPVMAMSGASPFGPWVEHGPVFNGSAGPFPQWDQWASNGALAIAGDGTAHLMYRSHAYTAGGLHFGERLGLATAHTWRGPFTKVRPGPILDEPNEDPFLWIDKRTGHFHAITHLERVLGRDGGSVGGRHLFSRDGVAWHVNTSHMWAGPNCPRPCSVPLDNGGTWSLQRRERPFILFDADGSTPRVVFSGVQLAEESAGAAEPRQPGRNSPQTFVMAQPVGRRGASRSGRRVLSASAATFSSVVNAAVPAPQLYASGDQTRAGIRQLRLWYGNSSGNGQL